MVCQKECLPGCPEHCKGCNQMRKKQNIYKVASEQRQPRDQSCSCEMECTGSDNSNCKESCYCKPDYTRGKTSTNQNKIKNVYIATFGKKDIDKLRKYLSKWNKNKKKAGEGKMTGDADNPEKNKLDIIDKIIKRYQHYRTKEEHLKDLGQQQLSLQRQQQQLKRLLKDDIKFGTKNKYASNNKDIAFDDQNISELITQKAKTNKGKKRLNESALGGVAKEEEVEEMRKQLNYIQQQQDALEKEQGLLSVEVQNQRDFFSQASQLVNNAVQQNKIPDDFQSSLNQLFSGSLALQEGDSNKDFENQYFNNEEITKYWNEQNRLLQLGGLDRREDDNSQKLSDFGNGAMFGNGKSVDFDTTDVENNKNNEEEENEDDTDPHDNNQQEQENDRVGINDRDDNTRSLGVGYGMAEDISYVDKKTVLPKLKPSKTKSRKSKMPNSQKAKHKKKS